MAAGRDLRTKRSEEETHRLHLTLEYTMTAGFPSARGYKASIVEVGSNNI
jgi:hypothetical protein